MTWKEKPLGEICVVNYGRSPKEVLSDDGTVPVIGTGGVERTSDSYVYEGESIVLGRKGTIDRPTYVTGKFWPIDTTFYLTNVEEVEVKYLYYAFLQQNLRALNESTGVPSVSRDALNNIYFKYPSSRSEQVLIVQILDQVEKATSGIEALISKYERVKMGLVQDIINRGIDENGNLRTEATHRFVTKQGIRVPEDWEVYSLDDITEHVGSGITPKGGSNVYTHSGVMLIRSQNVLVGEFDFSDVAYISEEINQSMKRSELQDLDVLLNITGASIGRSNFLPLGFPRSNVNQHVCAIRFKNKSLGKSAFLSAFLNDFKGQMQIRTLIGGSNREGLNYQQIRTIQVPMPRLDSDSEYERIRILISSVTSTIRSLNNIREKCHRLKSGLYQDLLTARVRVQGNNTL